MSGSAFDNRSCNGSCRSTGANFRSATGSSASNFVNSTTTGTKQVTGISERAVVAGRRVHHSQDHIRQRTFPQNVGLLDRVCPLGCSTCTQRNQKITIRPSYLPYRVNALLENGGSRTICNEVLHVQELVLAASFEALRIVKNQFLVAPENQLVLDVVDSSLTTVGDVVINDRESRR